MSDDNDEVNEFEDSVKELVWLLDIGRMEKIPIEELPKDAVFHSHNNGLLVYETVKRNALRARVESILDDLDEDVYT